MKARVLLRVRMHLRASEQAIPTPPRSRLCTAFGRECGGGVCHLIAPPSHSGQVRQSCALIRNPARQRERQRAQKLNNRGNITIVAAPAAQMISGFAIKPGRGIGSGHAASLRTLRHDGGETQIFPNSVIPLPDNGIHPVPRQTAPRCFWHRNVMDPESSAG